MNNPSVVKKLDHVVSMLKQADNRKFDPVLTAILSAKARIQNLEARLADTETMRDRIAMQLLPGVRADRDLNYSDELSIEYAYELADLTLKIRQEDVQ